MEGEELLGEAQIRTVAVVASIYRLGQMPDWKPPVIISHTSLTSFLKKNDGSFQLLGYKEVAVTL